MLGSRAGKGASSTSSLSSRTSTGGEAQSGPDISEGTDVPLRGTGVVCVSGKEARWGITGLTRFRLRLRESEGWGQGEQEDAQRP